ncbi:hypothetical protein B0A48_03105 [Cryoendolithus antarcticus]|uniref:Uncharacterized protein n=1 Tax=Cryoendolithus antarcticus TaxID=1507870 RepID=A0A1V8TM56_9PEZI|nr:hypothetical protein B0A48_03105 [Cryoendolithus antarcticus]
MKFLMFGLTGGTLLTLTSTAPVSASPAVNDPHTGQELVVARSAAQQDDISGWVDFDVNDFARLHDRLLPEDINPDNHHDFNNNHYHHNDEDGQQVNFVANHHYSMHFFLQDHVFDLQVEQGYHPLHDFEQDHNPKYDVDQDHLDKAHNPVHHIDLEVEGHDTLHYVEQDHIDQVEDYHALHDLDLVHPSATGHDLEEEHETLHDLDLDDDLVRPSSGLDIDQVLEQVQYLHLSSDLVDQDLAYGVLPNGDLVFRHQVGHSLDRLDLVRPTNSTTIDQHHHALPHHPLDVDGLDKHHLDHPHHPDTQPQQVYSRQPDCYWSCWTGQH